MATGTLGTRTISGTLTGSADNFATNPQSLVPKLLAASLFPLRNQSVMRALVNTNYDNLAAQKGDTINIPLPPNLQVEDVSPSATPQVGQPADWGNVAIPLDNWVQSTFRISDREIRNIDSNSFHDTAAADAVNKLSNRIDCDILQTYRSVYNIVGESSAGTQQSGSDDFEDPFGLPTSGASTDVAGLETLVRAGQRLNENAAYPQDRRMVLNSAAVANASLLRPFNDYSWSGTTETLQSGQVGTKFGFELFLDQNIFVHENQVEGTWTVNGGSQMVGASSLAVSVAAASDANASPGHGDIFRITGDDQTYVVISAPALANRNDAADVTWNISPPLKQVPSDNAAITFVPNHTVNLAFQKNAIVFASRPLDAVDVTSGNIIRQITDPISGLSLRMEASRQNKQTFYSLDVLYGQAMVRPEMCVRVAGKA